MLAPFVLIPAADRARPGRHSDRDRGQRRARGQGQYPCRHLPPEAVPDRPTAPVRRRRPPSSARRSSIVRTCRPAAMPRRCSTIATATARSIAGCSAFPRSRSASRNDAPTPMRRRISRTPPFDHGTAPQRIALTLRTASSADPPHAGQSARPPGRARLPPTVDDARRRAAADRCWRSLSPASHFAMTTDTAALISPKVAWRVDRAQDGRRLPAEWRHRCSS